MYLGEREFWSACFVYEATVMELQVEVSGDHQGIVCMYSWQDHQYCKLVPGPGHYDGCVWDCGKGSSIVNVSTWIE